MSKKKKIGALGTTAAAVVGGLALNQRVGATPLTLSGIGAFSESSTFTSSTYMSTNPTPGSTSFPHIINREFTNSGAYEIVPFIRIELSSIPAGSQITGAQLGLYFTDSTYYGGDPVRQEYMDLWAVKDEFNPATVNMTTYDGVNPWTDGFRAGVNHGARTGPAGSYLTSVFPTTAAPAGTPSGKLNNNVQEYKIFASDQLDNYLTTQHNLGKDAYLELTNSNGSGNAYRFVATSDNNIFGAHFDNVPKLDLDYAPLVPKWRRNDSGDWSTAANWFGQVVPNGVGAAAEFGGWTDVVGAQYPEGSIAVNVDSARTVGALTFDSDETYNLTGSNAVTMDVSSGSASINVLSGSQVISAPLVLNKNTTVTVAASAPSLTVSGGLSAAPGVTLTKAGGGILEVKNLRLAGVDVQAGTLQVVADGSAAGTSKVTSIAVGGGKLDLTNNKLVTASPLGTWGGSAYTGVSGLVDSGRGDASNAQWDGSGIVTSDTRAVNNNDLVSIGTAKVGAIKGIADTATTTFGGQTVLGSDSIAMVTWGGDANLDGKINIDDYGQIDFNVASSGSVFGWYNGDFNYDGKINIDDYGIIDFNVSAQDSVFPTTGGLSEGLAGAAAVPEPVSAAVVALAGITALTRRRRRSA